MNVLKVYLYTHISKSLVHAKTSSFRFTNIKNLV